MAGAIDFREIAERDEVRDSLNALTQLLGVYLVVRFPSGSGVRYGTKVNAESVSERMVYVGGQAVTLAFCGPSLTEGQLAAGAGIVKSLLGLAYAVDDLAAGADYVNEHVEQVLDIVSKTSQSDNVDALASRLLGQLREQFHAERAFAAVEPTGRAGFRVWLAEPAGEVRVNIMPVHLWERLKGEVLSERPGDANPASTAWPADGLPSSVREIMGLPEKPSTPIITRPLRVSQQRIAVVGVQSAPAFVFDSSEAQWLDILLGATAGRIAAAALKAAALDAVKKASGMAAHKLGSPTAALLAQIHLCQQDLSKEGSVDDLANRLQEMRDCAERIHQVNCEFKELVLTPRVRRQPVDLPDLLFGMVKAMVVSPHELLVEPLTRPLSNVSLDPELLRSVIEEIISNAKHAMPQGGTIRIGLTGPHEAGLGPFSPMERSYVTVAIADEGPGVPAEKRELVFEPFVTTRAEGTGLGLAIVKEYVRLLGGEVRVESPPSPAHGAIFLVALPISDTPIGSTGEIHDA